MGGREGLNDADFLARKKAAETELRTKSGDARDDRDPWSRIAAAQKIAAEFYKENQFLERGLAFNSELFHIARDLVRMAEELPKENSIRLKEYRDSALPSLKLRLFSEAPIYPDFEKAKLAQSLAEWKRQLPNDPLVLKVLKSKTPAQLASELVDGSKLADVAVRKAIAEGGARAVSESTDPMIRFALEVDPASRAVRKRREDQVEGVEEAEYARIAKALFDLKGDSVYPDATFTLRLAFGVVKGYEIGGRTIPPWTMIAGAFEHAASHGNQPPYRLPKSWFTAREAGRLHLDTPLNFVSTADIIGGNSGSPVVNRDNEVVGLIFDGNIQSLVLDFGYDDKIARAVSVDSRGILEALRSVYQADRIVNELVHP
jgi:hypothetical protein